jgi:hypothetical protein
MKSEGLYKVKKVKILIIENENSRRIDPRKKSTGKKIVNSK